MPAPDLDSESSTIWNLLLDAGMATEEQLTESWDEHERTGLAFKQVIFNYQIIKEDGLLQLLAENLGTELVDIKTFSIEQSLIELVPANIARFYNVFPLADEDGEVKVAACDATNPHLVDELSYVISRPVKICVAKPDDVMSAIDRYYPESTTDSMADVISEMQHMQASNQETDEEKDEKLAMEMANASPIIRFVNIILYTAVKDQASDIHFEPFGEIFKIRYRIDGVLYEMQPPPAHLATPVISRVKVVSGLNIAERRLPQDGRIESRVAGRKIDMRVATLPTQYGESVVLRILDRSVVNLDISSLGIPDNIRDEVKLLINRPNGIVLVTGPTGSGKTTTLYSCLKEVNHLEDKLLTAEDPVEYALEGIMQVPVNEAIGMTFAKALKAFLRQDPDIIMIGEIRDVTTASMAVQASLTGHLVLSTLHTNDAPSAVTRLVDMGVEPFLITSTLEGVLAQRLVRRVCKYCKTPYDPTDENLKSLNMKRDELGGQKFYYGKGCAECKNTGYRGRKGLFELFTLSGKSRVLINKKEPASVIFEQARREGMRTLREHGVESIISGETTVEEVLKYTSSGGAGGH
jgi:type IV pilus assembly protein PilB